MNNVIIIYNIYNEIPTSKSLFSDVCCFIFFKLDGANLHTPYLELSSFEITCNKRHPNIHK